MAFSMSFSLSCLLSLLKHLREGSFPFPDIDNNSDWCFSAMFVLVLFFKLKMNLISSAIGITQQRYMYWKMDQETSALTTLSSEAEDDDDQAAEPTKAAAPKRAKPRRKKRTRRGRA